MSNFKTLTLVQRIVLGLLLFHLILIYGTLSLMGIDDLLDSRLFYSSQEAFRYLSTLSPEKAKTYLHFECLDLGFLMLYTCTLFLVLRVLFNENKKIWFLALIPGCFDLLENIRIISALLFGPTEAGVSWLGTVTLLKFMALGALICLVLVGAVKRRPMPRSKF